MSSTTKAVVGLFQDYLQNTPCAPLQYFTIHEVAKITKLKPSTIYENVRDGVFPAPVNLTKRSSRWLMSDLMDWHVQLVATRDKKLSPEKVN